MPIPLFTGSLAGGTVSQLSAPIAVADGGTGTSTPGLVAGSGVSSITGTWPNQTINVASGGGGGVTSVAVTAPITNSGSSTAPNIGLSTPLSVANGGTGTSTPGLIAGTGIASITGSWPNQTINASTSGGQPTTLGAFSASSSGSNFNPNNAGATSNYYAGPNITAPATPYTIKLRIICQVSSLSVGYAGFLIGKSGGSSFFYIGTQLNSGGYVIMYITPLSGAATLIVSGFQNNGVGRVGATGVWELSLSVTDATHVQASGLYNGFGIGIPTTTTSIDLTGTIATYAVGAANTDVQLVQYQIYTASSSNLFV